MKYKREKDFLQILCRDWVIYLLENVGWTEIQAEIIKLRYLQHKSILRTCLDLAITSATYSRHYEKLSRLIEARFNKQIPIGDFRMIELTRAIEPWLKTLGSYIQ